MSTTHPSLIKRLLTLVSYGWLGLGLFTFVGWLGWGLVLFTAACDSGRSTEPLGDKGTTRFKQVSTDDLSMTLGTRLDHIEVWRDSLKGTCFVVFAGGASGGLFVIQIADNACVSAEK